MTLIVARQVNNEIYIVGDTKFSDSRLSEAARYRGGLKIVVLAPGLCVGFAGNVEFARDAIQGIYGRDVNLFDKNRTIDYFQFKYCQDIVVRGTPIPINNEPSTPISFGGVAEGSDIKQTGIFTAAGLGVFTVYWITGNVGLIYHPEESFEPTIISNCTQEEFRLRVIEKTSAAYQRAINYQSRF